MRDTPVVAVEWTTKRQVCSNGFKLKRMMDFQKRRVRLSQSNTEVSRMFARHRTPEAVETRPLHPKCARHRIARTLRIREVACSCARNRAVTTEGITALGRRIAFLLSCVDKDGRSSAVIWSIREIIIKYPYPVSCASAYPATTLVSDVYLRSENYFWPSSNVSRPWS
jgi:hypothetical protein